MSKGAMQSPPDAGREWDLSALEETFSDPLVDCFHALAKFHSHPVSREKIRAGLPTQEGVLTPSLLLRAAQRLGYAAKIQKRKLEALDNLTLPAILLLNNRQACLLMSVDQQRGEVHIIEPAVESGEKVLPISELQKFYLGYTIFVRPEYRFDRHTPEVFELRERNWFWGTMFKSWRIYRDVLVASFLINLFALASPLFIMNVYDRVVPHNALETLWVLTFGIAVVYLFDLLLRWMRSYFIDLAGRKSEIALSSMIFERIMGIRFSDRPQSAGAFASNIREFDSVREFIASASVSALVDIPFIVLFLAVISFIGGPLVWVPLAGLPVVILYSLIIQPALRRSIENTYRMSAQRNATLIEGLINLESIKTQCAEGEQQRKWEEAVAHISKWAVKSRTISSSALNIATAVQHFVTIGTVFAGVYLVSDGALSLGGLIACVILAGRAVAPLGQVASLASRYNQARASLHSLKGLMDLEQERRERQDYLHRPHILGDIRFNNVTFTYPGESSPVLSNFSLTIRAGERVCLVGRIGSGKSTIQKLIMGLYKPDSGSILVDGIDINQLDPVDLRKSIGYSPQDIGLLMGTVRENIALGVRHVDDEAIIRAGELAGVDEFVNAHPSGYDMQVGERGQNLSGGQKQAISVARALLLDPPILLLDEPTNSMDNTTEKHIRERLEDKVLEGKTLVLVTHRASMSDLCQRLVVVDDGAIVADGPREEVLSALKGHRLNIKRRKH